MEMCDVQYHEGTVAGQFQESVEIDRINGIYEKLHVPPVLDSRRSTIVHDFEKVDLLLLFNSTCVIILQVTRAYAVVLGFACALLLHILKAIVSMFIIDFYSFVVVI